MSDELKKRLDSFRSLQKNWNGYDADPIPSKAIDNAELIVRMMSSKIQVFPTAADSVQIEFDNDGDYLEIDVFSDRMTIFIKKKDGTELHGGINI